MKLKTVSEIDIFASLTSKSDFGFAGFGKWVLDWIQKQKTEEII